MLVHRKRILFIVPSLARAGAETQVVDLINGLPDDKIKKYLFTFEDKLSQLDRINQNNITFYNKKRKFKYDLSLAKHVSNIIDNENIDIIHCTLQISLLIGWLSRLLSKRKPKLLVAVHTTINRTIKDEIIDRLIYQWLMKTCDKIIFVCKTQMNYWQNKFRFNNGKTITIHNGIRFNYFDKCNVVSETNLLKNKYNIIDKSIVFCCIAAFRPEKAHNILISAFKDIVNETPHALLLLAGNGPEKENIEALVKNFGIEKQVIFLGLIDDVRPIISVSEFMIIPSVAVETFSIAMLESMSMGIPVIASDIGGAKEAVINDKTGYLIRPGNITDLAETMIKIVNNKCYNKMKKNCINIVQNNYTLDIMVQRTLDLLLSI